MPSCDVIVGRFRSVVYPYDRVWGGGVDWTDDDSDGAAADDDDAVEEEE